MSTLTTDYTAENKRQSYRNRLKAGDRVEFETGVVRTPAVRARAGMKATVLSETNAGFRGIEATVMADNGCIIRGVSTGILRKLP